MIIFVSLCDDRFIVDSVRVKYLVALSIHVLIIHN
jgi:hypothetical protein